MSFPVHSLARCDTYRAADGSVLLQMYCDLECQYR